LASHQPTLLPGWWWVVVVVVMVAVVVSLTHR